MNLRQPVGKAELQLQEYGANSGGETRKMREV